MKRDQKTSRPKRRDPYAKALELPEFRQRSVNPKKKYTRKGRAKWDLDDEDLT